MSTRTTAVLLSLGVALASGGVPAQDRFPSRPIRIIVPFPPGGQTDVTARLIGLAIGESLKTNVVIENKAGAHGFIGGAEVARAAPNGYTLLVASTGAIAINPVLHEKMPFDPARDFASVSLMISVPIVVMTNPKTLPVKDLKEFVAYAKARPGEVNFASAGSGGSSHLVAEYFRYRTGAAMTHIPFKGEAPATESVVSGQVQVMFNTLVGTSPHARSGRVRMLATTTLSRLPDFPDVPTVAEALQLPDFDASSWTALFAPTGTPPEIVRQLSAEVDAALKRPAVAKRLNELGAVPMGGPPERLDALQKSERAKWAAVIKAAGIKAD